jgi:O-antigen/teichoic acid export membrane protein
VIMGVCCIIAALVARPFVAFFYGQPFIGAANAILWLLPGVFLLSVNTIFMNFFAARGQPIIVIFSPFTALVVNVLLNLYFIPHFGISGAAMVSSISYAIMFAFSTIYIKVNTSIKGK